jgi:predicted ATPase
MDWSTDPDRSASRPRAGDGVAVPDRHASLDANLAWSYRLLSPPAARLLRWLAAWPGALDLAAVEWLTADWLDRGTACVAIADLVDAALVEVDLTATSATYRLLDPVRWPARRLAVAHGEAGRVRARHQLWQRQIAWVPTLQPLGEPVAG